MVVTPIHRIHAPKIFVEHILNQWIAAFQIHDAAKKGAEPRQHLRGIIDIGSESAGLCVKELHSPMALLPLQALQDKLLTVAQVDGHLNMIQIVIRTGRNTPEVPIKFLLVPEILIVVFFHIAGRDLLDGVEAKKDHTPATIVVAQKILPTGLRADIDLQWANRSLILSGTSQAANNKLCCAPFINGHQQITENVTVKRVEYVMVLEPESIRQAIQLIHQKGTDYAHRVFLRKEGQRICPGNQMEGLLICSLVEDLTATPFRPQ